MTFNLSRMLSAENSANDSAQSPACNKKPSPAATLASDAFSERASPANTSGGMRRSSSTTASTAAVSAHAGCCAAARRRQLAGSQSKFPNGIGAVTFRPLEIRAGLARLVAATAEFEPAPLAHLLELALRLHLLREQRGLDAVEESFEPADELRLRDQQLRFARCVAGEGQAHFVKLALQVVGQDAFE